ncbi:hypothetical protein [Alkaliphilus transvaalensis]|uniref:hypothetical protein n=1 Tax=Alkaliphilus transvaalensis TaxID=114628 RepID=UPI00047C60AF|nr:hypothetical protein [Alkaliphilus transvaalensis]
MGRIDRFGERLKKGLTQEKGESTLISLVKFFILFAVIGIAIEFYRIQTFQANLQTRLEIAAQDALELSMLDEFRRERISSVNVSQTEATLWELLQDELGLDTSLSPRKPSLLQTQLVIESIFIEEGRYAHNGTRYYNTEYPSIYLKGYTQQKLVLVPFLPEEYRFVEVGFNVFIENRRYD